MFSYTSVEWAEAVDPSEDVMSSVGAVGYSLSGLLPLPEPDGLWGGVGLEIMPISISVWFSSSSRGSSSSLLSFASDSAWKKILN